MKLTSPGILYQPCLWGAGLAIAAPARIFASGRKSVSDVSSDLRSAAAKLFIIPSHVHAHDLEGV